ncbi:hypothetical protein [Dermatobacter hominis]|uniref:hypothetical protein n=1 Tax=Dermatobacter hominis TaxID=2884263 RepID=UPI001D10605F|nr:hypothetical protein [Dermatobacter hominis]UDY35917.1 hypothetical protein LH044_21685 [Dermatobacter hominis]
MSRNRLIAAAVASVVVLGAAACAAPTTPTVPTVPGGWLAAGCIDGAGTDGNAAPDLNYSGTANQAGNATISAFLVGSLFSISGNGTCSGTPVGAITIVRGADQAAADTICSSLGQGTATAFAGSPWALPADAWSCSNTIVL